MSLISGGPSRDSGSYLRYFGVTIYAGGSEVLTVVVCKCIAEDSISFDEICRCKPASCPLHEALE
jgi:hypothetical protein